MSARRVHFVSGVVTDAMLDVEGVTIIDPLPLEPRLNRFQRNMIRLSLTLEQQFFLLAEYLGNTSGGSAHGVIGSGRLLRSLLTFGVSLASATRWWTTCGGGGVVFVVGLSAGGAGGIARHVASHGVVRVFVVFSEFSLLQR
ncbi:receptor-type adenylate cyclase, putative [Trypanosoma cruzi]|nr:receptor-type adenylate cyclase, putative [Trypanosoma cruzi]